MDSKKESSLKDNLLKAITKSVLNKTYKELTKSGGIATYPPKKTIVSFTKKVIEESIK